MHLTLSFAFFILSKYAGNQNTALLFLSIDRPALKRAFLLCNFPLQRALMMRWIQVTPGEFGLTVVLREPNPKSMKMSQQGVRGLRRRQERCPYSSRWHCDVQQLFVFPICSNCRTDAVMYGSCDQFSGFSFILINRMHPLFLLAVAVLVGSGSQVFCRLYKGQDFTRLSKNKWKSLSSTLVITTWRKSVSLRFNSRSSVYILFAL